MSDRRGWGLDEALEQRRRDHLLRTLRTLDSAQGPRIRVDGRDFLAFCSNDYLGLAADPRLAAAMRAAAARHGTGSGASALVCGRHRLHAELEEALADFTGRERCLLFSTGYMANLGVATALFNRADTIFSDTLNHASLIDAARVCGAAKIRFAHGDAGDLAARLRAHGGRRRAVMSDGLFSMDGDLAPVTGLADACRAHNAALWIDDAHGLGVLGETGRGTLEAQGSPLTTADILVGTLGKAFGAAGAFVAADAVLVETLVQHARNYIYTTAPPPPVAAAALAGLQVSRAEPERRAHLLALVRRFRAGAAALGLRLPQQESPIQPVILGDARQALELGLQLQAQGILALAMRPPTVPAGTSRLRLTFSATHTTADIDRLLEAFATALADSRRRHATG